MFFESEEINKLTNCSFCKNKYVDPRVVECGQSFCMPCIEFMKNDQNGFTCPVCNDFHGIPNNGYVKNSNLSKLCDLHENNVSRGTLADNLKAQLNEIKLKYQKLNVDNESEVDKIKDYCDGLKNEVQLSSEELIESIKMKNLEMIEEIENYQKDSVSNFKRENKLKLEKFIQTIHAFHTKCDDYLKEFKLDKNNLISASIEANAILEHLSKANDQMLFSLFSGALLKFKKNPIKSNSSLHGSLVYENIPHSIFEFNLSTLSGPLLVKFQS